MDFPSSRDINSTVNLLGDLDLIDRNACCNKTMDDMEVDLVLLEIPDTPDRLEMLHSINGEESIEVKADPFSSKATMGQRRNTHGRERGDSCTLINDTNQIRRAGGRLAKSHQSSGLALPLEKPKENGRNVEIVDLSEKSPFSLSYPNGCRNSRMNNGKGLCRESGLIDYVRENSMVLNDVENNALECGDEDKRFDLSDDQQAKIGQVPSRPLRHGVSQWQWHRKQLKENRGLAPCSSSSSIKSNGQPKVDGQLAVKFANGKNISDLNDDPKNEFKLAQSRILDLDASYKKTMPKGIMGNHRTSPCDIQGETDGQTIDKKKGKMKLDDNPVFIQHNKVKTRPGRACSTSNMEVTVIADMDDAHDTLRSHVDSGWRTTRSRSENSSECSPHEIGNLSKKEGTKGFLTEKTHETSIGEEVFMNHVQESPSLGQASTKSESKSRRRCVRDKRMDGKRRCSSVRSISGESSSSVVEDSETPYNPKSTTTRTSHCRDTILGPVIEVDELYSPESRCPGDQEHSHRVSGAGSTAFQVESDEVLARLLQEQFYDESPRFRGMEELDATIARSLQEDESRLAASTARRGQIQPRHIASSHLYEDYPNLSYHDASALLANHVRVPRSSRMGQFGRNFSNQVDLETMLGHLRRNLNSGPMDVEMRLNLLDELEVAFDNTDDVGLSNASLQIENGFNENGYDLSYEMLLALDDNNHQHAGASEVQINSLPQSLVQNDSIEEACAVCLEIPIVGDTIRHLPCFHKFHKDCIDAWLKRRTLCPICKSGVL